MPYTRRKERENMELGGLVPALVTPFDREGKGKLDGASQAGKNAFGGRG